jgi:hypothetical protein
MKAPLLFALAAVLLTAAPVLAQPVVSLSASGGYVPGTLTHTRGAALDAAVNVQWGRALVGLHVAELTYARVGVGRLVANPATGETRIERGTEADFDYGVGLDASYVQPLGSKLALFAGAGIRFQGNDIAEPRPSGVNGTAEIAYLQTGLLIGRTDAVHTAVRVVIDGRGIERVQAGVVVPIRLGR